MADSVADRVREQVSGFGGGTGVVTLTGTPVASFQPFLSGWGASGTGDYCLVMGSQWEVGFGTLNAGGTTLTRTTPYGSYSGGTFTAGAACNFSAGTLDCFGDIPAELAHYLNMREFAVAAASPTDIGAVMGSCININGSSTTISSFGTKKNRRRFVRMGTAQTITHNASSLILPGGASISAAAGDTFIAQSDSSGNWRVISYTRGSAAPGPSSSTDKTAVRFSGTGGSTQTSALVIDDTTGRISRSGNGGIQVQGTNTNDSASAGDKGEYVSASVASGSAVALTNNTAKTVTSISLTAGDWDVNGQVGYTQSGATFTEMDADISLTNNTYDSTAGRFVNMVLQSGNLGASTLQVSNVRMSLSSTTTVFLIAFASFSAGSVNGYGGIWARRIR